MLPPTLTGLGPSNVDIVLLFMLFCRLQASMTQLLLYYTRMLELLKKQGPEGMALAREGVNIPAIMYEIKRITKA